MRPSDFSILLISHCTDYLWYWACCYLDCWSWI